MGNNFVKSFVRSSTNFEKLIEKKYSFSLVPNYLLITSCFFFFKFQKTRSFFADYLEVEHYIWARFFFNQNLTLPNNFQYIMDGFFFSTRVGLALQYNICNLQSDERLFLKTFVEEKNFCISSVSVIFNSCTWLERELCDFSGLVFLGLSDTRRLLLDYFEVRGFWQTHISNDKNFSNNIYDVTLNF